MRSKIKTLFTSSGEKYALLVIFLISLPLAVIQLVRLWGIAHYQFFPFVLAASAFIIWTRWNNEPDEQPSDVVLATEQLSAWGLIGSSLLLWSGVLLLAASYVVFSPWLGYIAALLCWGGILWRLVGDKFYRIASAWGLLWILVRPPLKIDLWLIQWLQQNTAGLSSFTLDWLGIAHFRQGVVIELPSRVLFVEEACSGVQSLFSFLALAAIIAVWNQRSLLFTVILVLASVLGAAAMNVARIVLITWGEASGNYDFLKEPDHTYLGLGIFLVAFLWMISCDQLLRFFLGPIPLSAAEQSHLNSAREPKFLKLVFKWNRWVVGSRSIDAGIMRLPKKKEQEREPLPTWLKKTETAGIIAASFVAVVFSGGGWLASSLSSDHKQSAVSTQNPAEELKQKIGELHQNSLPPELLGWKQKSFETKKRAINAEFGELSKQWVYESEFGLVLLSVDSKYKGWHDLRLCYTNTGWTVIESEVERKDPDLLETMTVQLIKPGRNLGFLLFEAFDKSGQTVAAPNQGSNINSVTGRFSFPWQDILDDTPDVFQIQVVVFTETPLMPDDRGQLKKWYFAAREKLLEQLRLVESDEEK